MDPCLRLGCRQTNDEINVRTKTPEREGIGQAIYFWLN
jgi:hypothetical protein